MWCSPIISESLALVWILLPPITWPIIPLAKFPVFRSFYEDNVKRSRVRKEALQFQVFCQPLYTFRYVLSVLKFEDKNNSYRKYWSFLFWYMRVSWVLFPVKNFGYVKKGIFEIEIFCASVKGIRLFPLLNLLMSLRFFSLGREWCKRVFSFRLWPTQKLSVGNWSLWVCSI